MHIQNETRPGFRRLRTLAVAATVVAASIAGCSSDDDDGATASVTYAGTFASAVGSGSISITTGTAVAARSEPGLQPANLIAVNVTGLLTFTPAPPAPVTLTGTLDGTALALAGSNYTFTGTLSGTQISGTFTDPDANTGGFAAAVSTTGAAARAFCGSYAGFDGETPESGTFNLVLADNGTGAAVIVEASGSLNTLSVRLVTGNVVELYEAGDPETTIASGTITGESPNFVISDGVYSNGATSSGTFEGAICD